MLDSRDPTSHNYLDEEMAEDNYDDMVKLSRSSEAVAIFFACDIRQAKIATERNCSTRAQGLPICACGLMTCRSTKIGSIPYLGILSPAENVD